MIRVCARLLATALSRLQEFGWRTEATPTQIRIDPGSLYGLKLARQ